MRLVFIAFTILIFSELTSAQEKVIYKTIDTISLQLEVIYPEKVILNEKHPAMVFFFGGGWKSGTTGQFLPHARHYAEKGIVCFLVDYRVESRHQTSPFESLKDAKSAIRFVRINADRFHIDPEKIIACGGSAGGHLAAASSIVNKYNDESDNHTVSSKANALVLFNPVIDNGPGGYGFERIGEEYLFFSPLHNLHTGTPPTIFFLGSNDALIPTETAKYYQTVMQKIGSRCDLHIYEGQTHGFFNYKNTDFYNSTVSKTDDFLRSLGYIQ